MFPQKMTISQAKAYCQKHRIPWEQREKRILKCHACGAYVRKENQKRQIGNFFMDPCEDCTWELALGNLPHRFDWDDESLQLSFLEDLAVGGMMEG